MTTDPGLRDLGSPEAELALHLLAGPDREVEHIEWTPLADKSQTTAECIMVPVWDEDARVCSVNDLHRRLIRTRRFRRREPSDDHPIIEGIGCIRPKNEVSRQAPDRTEAPGDGREDVLEPSFARHPKLVRVAVDHPVRIELRRREPCHPSYPLALW